MCSIGAVVVVVAALLTATATQAAPADNDLAFATGGAASGAGFGFYPQPDFPTFPQFDFNGYFVALQKYHQELMESSGDGSGNSSSNSGGGGAYAYSFTSGDNNFKVNSSASITFNRDYRLQRQIEAAQRSAVNSGQFERLPAPPGGAAIASGAIGPSGVYQQASVFPQNPAVPNVATRSGVNPSGSGNGFYGVSSSSFSTSSNVNGKPTHYRQASTTVNDNGKVSTYTVHDP